MNPAMGRQPGFTPTARVGRGAMSPKSQALAFRIWAYCDPKSWDCTIAEIAEALDVHPSRVTQVVGAKDWRLRLRSDRTDKGGNARLASDHPPTTRVAREIASITGLRA